MMAKRSLLETHYTFITLPIAQLFLTLLSPLTFDLSPCLAAVVHPYLICLHPSTSPHTECICSSNLKKIPKNHFMIFSTFKHCRLFSPCSSQKRAKKIEGETIYIKHSNLMLEVCIETLEMSCFCRCMSHCMRFCFILFLSSFFSPHTLLCFVL